MIGSVAAKGAGAYAAQAKGSFGYSSQTGAKSEVRAKPTPQVPRAPSGVLGQAPGAKPGHQGATGTQGPAPGIQSPTRVQAQPKEQARNIKANADGSISYAAGARIDTKVTVTQQTPEPATPLKSRAEGMRGTHVDARG